MDDLLEVYEETREPGDYVADGRVICGLKGPIKSREPISPDMLSHGQETFDTLKTKGYIITVP